MKNRKQLTYSFLLIIGVLGLINILANTFFLRLDLTEDKRYTLSKATKNILKELKDPVTVTAYFSKNLPTELIKGREDFKDLLVEYASRSKNKLVYEFVNPSENDESEQKAVQAGVHSVNVEVREKDGVLIIANRLSQNLFHYNSPRLDLHNSEVMKIQKIWQKNKFNHLSAKIQQNNFLLKMLNPDMPELKSHKIPNCILVFPK